ncbi:hypothetical protein Hypma_016475 [Hypsizygus marmoreus]|uniref:F-box domain-containing protein n=1 Tax=Hypsizygus marmoreus TaxID=39966 RepID=A0A369IYF4_HYPMA|nr:hypothetical protein Hypma_016475 [Hypsizygus marmoreus]
MHRCFLVPEIVDLICYQIQNGDGSPSEWLEALARLARTCQAVHEPALNYLWRELRSLMPLVKCMPADLLKVTQGRFPRVELVRPIVPSDWPRFKENARRVRTFGLGYGVGELTMETYQALSMAAGGQALLPNIQELVWNFSAASFPYIHLLTGSNITTFSLSNPALIPYISTMSLLTSMNTRYPGLTHLSLTDFREEVEVAAISSAVCGWNHFRYLKVGALSNDALVHIAALPSLSHLHLQYRAVDRSHIKYPLSRNSCAFPAVRTMIISSPDFSFCTDLLRSMSPGSSLKNINFSTTKFVPSTSMEWTNVIQALHDICDHSALEHLSLRDNEEDLDQFEDQYPNVVGPKHLKPLLAFSRLTSISLRANGGFDLDDPMVNDMAVAWPRLTNLRVSSDFAPSPRATISALTSLAQHCPRIMTLTMAFNAEPASIPTPTSSPRVSNTQLKSLNVENSPISHAPSVAAFLSDIFPKIATVFVNENDNIDEETELEKAWGEVQNLLWVFASVRDHETSRRLRMLQ